MQTLNDSTNTNVSIQITALDALMNLAGELVLGRNQLLQAISADDKRLLETTSQRIDMVTSEIQEQIMRTRMQPMGMLFENISQVVKELSFRSGKKVELTVIVRMSERGDKTIMEAIDGRSNRKCCCRRSR
jgi:two-component system chemotaxis sensor kinase CheA